MFLRNWINILLLLSLAYCARQVMTGYANQLAGWQYCAFQLSPWVLLYGSLKAWHRCFTWRRMLSAKNTSPELSRGLCQPSKQKQHPGILELASLSFVLLSIVAILNQLGITKVSW